MGNGTRATGSEDGPSELDLTASARGSRFDHRLEATQSDQRILAADDVRRNTAIRPCSISVPSIDVFVRLAPAVPTKVYDTYWRFAAERQRVFFDRIANPIGPWTKDPILRQYKFTNAYRASDRTSQYLIREVIYKGDQAVDEVFFRILLFKIFNKIETWERLQAALGEVRYATFRFDAYDHVLTTVSQLGASI